MFVKYVLSRLDSAVASSKWGREFVKWNCVHSEHVIEYKGARIYYCVFNLVGESCHATLGFVFAAAAIAPYRRVATTAL